MGVDNFDLGNFPGQHIGSKVCLWKTFFTLELTSFDETSPNPNSEPALAKVPKTQAKCHKFNTFRKIDFKLNILNRIWLRNKLWEYLFCFILISWRCLTSPTFSFFWQ